MVSLSHTQFKTLHNSFWMHNFLLWINKWIAKFLCLLVTSLKCICWSLRSLKSKLKIYTKHGVLVHGLPLWTNPTLKIFTSRVLMNFTNLKWTKLCQFKIILSGLKASHITHLLIFFFLNSTQWVWFSPEGETIWRGHNDI